LAGLTGGTEDDYEQSLQIRLIAYPLQSLEAVHLVHVSGVDVSDAEVVVDDHDTDHGAAGVTFSQVVKATVYLTDMANFQTLNAIYSEYMGDHKPSRTTVAVAALPKNALVEIDFVATTA